MTLIVVVLFALLLLLFLGGAWMLGRLFASLLGAATRAPARSSSRRRLAA